MESVFQAAVRYIRTTQYESLPPAALEKARICLLDTFAAAALGRQCRATQIARKTALAGLGCTAQQASLWFEPALFSVPGALFVNCTAASAADIDDGLDLNRGHAGSPVIPAVLAVCEAGRLPLRQALAAIAVGYELMYVASEALLPYGARHYPIDHGTGSLAALAVAGAVANHLGEEELVIAEALRVAQAYMPGGNNDRAVESGGMTKENINWGALSGYFALQLARGGYTGQSSVLERLPRRGEYLRYFTADFSALCGTYVKLHASCRFTHWPVEALARLGSRVRFRMDQVEGIQVRTFRSATKLLHVEAPGVEAVQYSIPLCLAIFMKYGQLNRPEKLLEWAADPEVQRVAARVSLKWDRRFERKGDEGEGCRIEVRLKDGARHIAVSSSLPGDRRHPLSYAEVAEKFLANCCAYMPEAGILKLIDCLRDAENQSVEHLMSAARLIL